MPDLGKYAFAVLASYGVAGVALAGIVGWSLLRHRQVRARLQALERERGGRNG